VGAGEQRKNLVSITEWRLYELLGCERKFDAAHLEELRLWRKIESLEESLKQAEEKK